MTEQEYDNIVAEQESVIKKAQKGEIEARRKIADAREEFCQSLTERYTDYVGKKVEIVFSVPIFNRKECRVKTVVGYLLRFEFGYYTQEFRPVLAKLKKDGTAGHRHYSEWDVENYKYISQIKIIE